MPIKSISIENFKSFEQIELNFFRFDLIIGPNASGKSNFIQILKFIKDLDIYGLNNAISIQGGVDFFRNINIGADKNFKLAISFLDKTRLRRTSVENPFEMEQYRIDYSLEIFFYKSSNKYKIQNEQIIQYFNC